MYVRMDPLDSKSTGASSGASTRDLCVAAVVDMRWRPIAAVRWAAKAVGRDIVFNKTCRAYIWLVNGRPGNGQEIKQERVSDAEVGSR